MSSGEKGAKAYLRAAAGYFLQSGLGERFAKSRPFRAILRRSEPAFSAFPDWLAERTVSGLCPALTSVSALGHLLNVRATIPAQRGEIRVAPPKFPANRENTGNLRKSAIQNRTPAL